MPATGGRAAQVSDEAAKEAARCELKEGGPLVTKGVQRNVTVLDATTTNTRRRPVCRSHQCSEAQQCERSQNPRDQYQSDGDSGACQKQLVVALGQPGPGPEAGPLDPETMPVRGWSRSAQPRSAHPWQSDESRFHAWPSTKHTTHDAPNTRSDRPP